MSYFENDCLSASLPVNQNGTSFKTICYKIKQLLKVMANLHFWQIQYLNSLVLKLLQNKEHAENYTAVVLFITYTAIILLAFKYKSRCYRCFALALIE